MVIGKVHSHLRDITRRKLNQHATTYAHNTMINTLTNFNPLPAHPNHTLFTAMDKRVQYVLKPRYSLTKGYPPHILYAPLEMHGHGVKTFFLSTI